jgi:hypothetical protein
MQDLIAGDGYTLLKLGRTQTETSGLENAIRSFGAPLTVMEVPDQIARDIYEFDLILLRPDMHIVWRGQQAPDDAALVAAVATGH